MSIRLDDIAKNGLPYFYSVVAFDHVAEYNVPIKRGLISSPMANFQFVTPRSDAQSVEGFDEGRVYVVPNPVTPENIDPWRLEPNNTNPSGWKLEFRNLPACVSTIRIYTIAGDLVQVLNHDGSSGAGTCPWDMLTRNGQDIASGVYLFSVDADDNRFPRVVDKFVVIK